MINLWERFCFWLAFKLPKRLIFWCGMRIIGHATSGQWSNASPNSLNVMDAIERWGITDHCLKCMKTFTNDCSGCVNGGNQASNDEQIERQNHCNTTACLLPQGCDMGCEYYIK